MTTPPYILHIRFMESGQSSEVESGDVLKITNDTYAGAECVFTFGFEGTIPLIIVSNLSTPSVNEDIVLAESAVQIIIRDRLGPESLARFLQFMDVPNLTAGKTAAQPGKTAEQRAAERWFGRLNISAPTILQASSSPKLAHSSSSAEGRFVVVRLRRQLEHDELFSWLHIDPNTELLPTPGNHGRISYIPLTHGAGWLACIYTTAEAANRLEKETNFSYGPVKGVVLVTKEPPADFYPKKGPGRGNEPSC